MDRAPIAVTASNTLLLFLDFMVQPPAVLFLFLAKVFNDRLHSLVCEILALFGLFSSNWYRYLSSRVADSGKQIWQIASLLRRWSIARAPFPPKLLNSPRPRMRI